MFPAGSVVTPHARPLALSPPFQVPSAFRRGGLKTPWGSPVRLGSGAFGPVEGRGKGRGEGASSPLSPPPHSSSLPDSASPSPWEGGNPWAPVGLLVLGTTPPPNFGSGEAVAPDRPRGHTFPTHTKSGLVCLSRSGWPPPEAPPRPPPYPRRPPPPYLEKWWGVVEWRFRVGERRKKKGLWPCQGAETQTKKNRKRYDS